MPRPRARPLFELGEYWIAKEPGRPQLYAYWKDQKRLRTRRISLGTEDLERGKKKLRDLIGGEIPDVVEDYLADVLESYFENRTDGKPSEKQTRNAGKVVLKCWGPLVRVRDLSEAKQREFCEWCVGQGFRLSYAARNLTVIAAALRYSNLVPPEKIAINDNKMRDRWNLIDKASRRRFIPSDRELGRLLSCKMPEKLFRWLIIQLNTGGRPQTAVDLKPEMRNRQAKLIHLNPPDRRQNRKFRATVRETRTLRGWLDAWEKVGLGAYGGRYVGYTSLEGVKTALQTLRIRKTVNLPLLSTYSFRHKVTTVLRQARVSEDQIAQMLGHRRFDVRSTGAYGEWDPTYLADAGAAIDAWFNRLQQYCTRNLISHGNPTRQRAQKSRPA